MSKAAKPPVTPPAASPAAATNAAFAVAGVPPAAAPAVDIEAIRAQVRAEVAQENAALFEQIKAEELGKLRASAAAAAQTALVEELKVAAQKKVLLEAKPVRTDRDHRGFPKEWRFVEIHASPNKSDAAYQDLSVQGHAIRVRRGEKVPLNRVYVTVLDQAITEVTINGVVDDKNVFQSRAARRFPYSDLGPCTEDQYKEFMQKNGAMVATIS